MAIKFDELLEALDPSLDKFEEDLDSMWIIIPTERRYDDLTASDYDEFINKYGIFNSRQECWDKIDELAPDRWDAFIPLRIDGVNESLNEALNRYTFGQDFENYIPHNMRYKEYDFIKDNGQDILYWITQDTFDDSDIKEFKNALSDKTDFDGAFVILRDDSSYSYDKDKNSGKGAFIKNRFTKVYVDESLKEDYLDPYIDELAMPLSKYMQMNSKHFNAVCDYIDDELRKPGRGLSELSKRDLETLYSVFIEGDRFNESLNLNEGKRISATKNVYTVIDAMNWNKPMFMDRTANGYKCKWGGHNFLWQAQQMGKDVEDILKSIKNKTGIECSLTREGNLVIPYFNETNESLNLKEDIESFNDELFYKAYDVYPEYMEPILADLGYTEDNCETLEDIPRDAKRKAFSLWLKEMRKRAAWNDDMPSAVYDIIDLVDSSNLGESLNESLKDKNSFIDWLSEHEQAWEDCCNYFELNPDDEDALYQIDPAELEDWIYDHEQLAKDYLNHFNESLNLKEGKELPIRKILNDNNIMDMVNKNPRAALKKALELVSDAPNISEKDKLNFKKALSTGPESKRLSSLATYFYDVNKAGK